HVVLRIALVKDLRVNDFAMGLDHSKLPVKSKFVPAFIAPPAPGVFSCGTKVHLAYRHAPTWITLTPSLEQFGLRVGPPNQLCRRIEGTFDHHGGVGRR